MLTRFGIHLALAAICAFFLCACGAHSGHPVALDNAPAAGQQGTAGIGLPLNLNELPAARKKLSIIGPGWTPLEPQETIAAQNTAIGPGDALTLNAAGDMAFAIYGLAGFDGDNGPTSARIAQSALTGEYFVAFSDYVSKSWRTAGPFTGDATVEIPLPSGEASSSYTSPSAFCSPPGTCYLAVIVPTGGVLTLTGVELGVQGGHLGPMWTSISNITGGPNGCLVTWMHSIDYTDPDFAGYLLERAALLSGDFTALAAEPIREDYFIDTGAQLDTEYRYRLAAVDASGNTSMWTSSTGGAVTGGKMDPVAVLKLPRGPLSSPAEVELDLSESFDPEGVGITTYGFYFRLYPQSISGGDASPTVSLPPGQHLIIGGVTTSDGRSSTTFAVLKVYPTWSDSPAALSAPLAAGTWRLTQTRAAFAPGTELPALIGYNPSIYGLVCWRQNTLGQFNAQTVPFYSGAAPEAIGEPLAHGEDILVPAASADSFYIARFGQTDEEILGMDFNNEGFAPIAAAADTSDNVYVFVAQDNAGQIDLMSFDMTDFSAGTVVLANITNLFAIDAEYNADLAVFDIVYANAAGTNWVRWDQAGGSVIDSASIVIGASSRVDVELSPVTGRPGLVFFQPFVMRWVYTELDATSTWIAPEIIDNAGANRDAGDFAYGSSDEAYVYFALAPGQSHLYERTGIATWTPRNTPAYAADGGYQAALLNLPGTDEFLAADGVGEKDLILGRLTAMPPDETVWTLPRGYGFGIDIQTAAGTDDATPAGTEELHVLYGNSVTTQASHYISDDEGASWAPLADVAMQYYDLAASSEGRVYASSMNAPNHELFFWDPALNVFTSYVVQPANGNFYSFIGSDINDDHVWWTSYDSMALALSFVEAKVGEAPVVSTYTAEDNPVWAGAMSTLSQTDRFFAAIAGGSTSDAALSWGTDDSGSMNMIANSFIAKSLGVYGLPQTANRQVAMAACSSGSFIEFIDTVIYSAYGSFYDAQRFSLGMLDGLDAQTIALPFDPTRHDMRRTVTAGTGAGATAIGIVSAIDGSGNYMEWGNYGEWEELPVPRDLKTATLPELLIGRDGNWHIIFRNWKSDRVLCLSTAQ